MLIQFNFFIKYISDYGITFYGELNGNHGSGQWSSSADGSTGFWAGNNYNQ